MDHMFFRIMYMYQSEKKEYIEFLLNYYLIILTIFYIFIYIYKYLYL